MRTASWILAATLVLGSVASTQAQVALPSSGAAPAPLPADRQDLSRVIFAATTNLMKFQKVEGLPFAATGKILVEQTLADGSTIKNSYDVAVWRDAEGRTRVEYATKLPGLSNLNRMVTVWDPKSGTNMTWSTGNLQVPVVMLMHMPVPGTNAKSSSSTGLEAAVLPPPPPGVQSSSQTGTTTAPARVPHNVMLPAIAGPVSRNFSKEDLPADTIAGLYVTGVRTTTIIPAGTAGNERDITVTSETWTSPDLKITVRQITDDPRSGKVTTELTDVTRTDPDPALFQAPEGYTVKDMSLPVPATH